MLSNYSPKTRNLSSQLLLFWAHPLPNANQLNTDVLEPITQLYVFQDQKSGVFSISQ